MLCRPFFQLTLFLILLPQSSVANTGDTREAIPIPPMAKQITKQGTNRHPLFISDKSIIFVSEDRKAHKDAQLYFLDLQNLKEKRLTHQRGVLNSGVVADKKLFFSSSTDEEKETPLSLKPMLKRFPSHVNNDAFFHLNFNPQEIYSSAFDGSQIERVTHSMGFDGFPVHLPNKRQLLFSHWDGEQLQVYRKTLGSRIRPIPITKTKGHDLGLKLSPDQKSLLWARFSPGFSSSQIMLAGLNMKDPQFVTLESGLNWSPTWHPSGNSIIYSAKAKNHGDFDLYEVSKDGNCQRRIASFPGDEFFPAVSPDGKQVLFTSTQSGQEQIHAVDYPSTPLCPPQNSPSPDE